MLEIFNLKNVYLLDTAIALQIYIQNKTNPDITIQLLRYLIECTRTAKHTTHISTTTNNPIAKILD